MTSLSADSKRSLVNDRLVTIIAGSDKKHESYKVQRSLLLKASEWFEKALTPAFQEGTDLVLRFPETNSDVVKLFLQWLFQGRLPTKEEEGVEDDDLEHHELLMDLWVFADAHFLPNCKTMHEIPLPGGEARIRFLGHSPHAAGGAEGF